MHAAQFQHSTEQRSSNKFSLNKPSLGEAEEGVGTSLFHQKMAQRRLLSPEEEMILHSVLFSVSPQKFLLHRLIVISHLPHRPSDKSELGDHYQKMNQSLQRCYPGDGITGLLLIYPTCLLHLMECSTEVLVSILQDLGDTQGNPHCALIQEPRVLLVSHDIPNRLFPEWNYRLLTMSAHTLSEEPHTDNTEKLASDTLALLLKLGKCLLEASKGSTESPLSVLDEMPELIVPQDVVSQLVAREDLMTPQQYLQSYYMPLDVLMDSEPYTCIKENEEWQLDTYVAFLPDAPEWSQLSRITS
ncbi:testis-expressed protein 47 [Chanos chanos]|uniref:Testis-expressed protein 47 n=1 Tax=Chanos chanos TaxID=29144 RepID=A0A6J2VFV7_CHACN|nr:testis-expressed protein 47 [Chanos chanos]